MMDELLGTIIVLGLIAGVTVVMTPIARAIARRIDARARGTEDRLATLEAVVADMQDDHARVARIEDRLNRSSRTRAGSPRRRSERPARPPEPRVGKLWTPPPYDA